MNARLKEYVLEHKAYKSWLKNLSGEERVALNYIRHRTGCSKIEVFRTDPLLDVYFSTRTYEKGGEPNGQGEIQESNE